MAGKGLHSGSVSEENNEENQVFEITDFTTATDWEKFIADLEEILRKWNGLAEHPPSKNAGDTVVDQSSQVEFLKFGKVSLTARLFVYHPYSEDNPENEEDLGILKDIIDPRYDFPHRVHCIYRWFGAKRFMVISPLGGEMISSSEKSKLLLSSAAIAMSNTNIHIPIFVELYHAQRKYFSGIYEAPTLRINYDMVHVKSMPDNYYYLSALADLFRSKISSPLVDKLPVTVSVRFTHIIKDWPSVWVGVECDDVLKLGLEERLNDVNRTPLISLEYQTSANPIDEFHLSASWSDLDERIISDSSTHCNLDSMTAPRWTSRVVFKDKFTKDLVQSIEHLLDMAKNSKYSDQVLGHYTNFQEERELEARAALDKLAGPPTFILPQIKTTVRCTISQELRDRIMRFLFARSTHWEDEGNLGTMFKDYRCFKSSPFNSLTWRLAMLFYHVKDFSLLAFLWDEVIKELREHWEALVDLPRLESGAPNLFTCLLNQKFQMLNCCIQQRRKREESINNPVITSENADEPEDEDEQFFDAVDQEELTEKAAAQPEGRLHKLSVLRLLKTGEPLFVPVTQEPPPMTEDMVQEQARVLAEVGTSPEAAELRARMQSASLMSDMEAFKAANPGCILEDFVRWHSPRDYTEEQEDNKDSEGGKEEPEAGIESASIHKKSNPSSTRIGVLSSRMQHPGNMWREAWDAAKAIPVSRQRRLFDYTKEAERVLHNLASFTLKDLILALLPNIIHCATSQLIRDTLTLTEGTVKLDLEANEIGRRCIAENFESCLIILAKLESKLIKLRSLKKVFISAHRAKYQEWETESFMWSKIGTMALQLAQDLEFEVPGACVDYPGNLIAAMFSEAAKLVYEERTSIGERVVNDNFGLPPPSAKEYILKTSCPRPSVYSKSLPQRMFALITPNEYRISGAFVEDTLFR